MKSILLVAASAALCVSTFAAAAPLISGKYILTEHRMCQAKETFHFAPGSGAIGNYVDQVNVIGGEIGNSLIFVNFNATKGTLSGNGFDGSGDAALVALSGQQNITLGNAYQEKTFSGNKIAYANDDTTFTLDGTVFHVFYGQVDKNNIAHYAAYQGSNQNDSGAPCSVQGTIVRQ